MQMGCFPTTGDQPNLDLANDDDKPAKFIREIIRTKWVIGDVYSWFYYRLVEENSKILNDGYE